MFLRNCGAALAVVVFVTCWPRATVGESGDPEIVRPERVVRRVRVVYVVSSDREEKAAYTVALEHAIRDLQKWYGRQLGGPTFRLNEPVVEVVKSDRAAEWFYAHPNGDDEDSWGFNNALAEANRLVGARQGDPRFVWVIYSDGPGNKGRGGGGVTCLPEDDLLGLVGRHPTQKDKLRWIGGLGHELGHAFGLPHPDDTEKHADAIMWAGFYGKYPDKAYLTEADKRILMRSPFFYRKDGTPVFRKGKVIARYTYDGGAFERHAGKSPIYWTETKTDGTGGFLFEEVERDAEWIILRDPTRAMLFRLPVCGGVCAFSTDGGETWMPLYEVAAPSTAGEDGKRRREKINHGWHG